MSEQKDKCPECKGKKNVPYGASWKLQRRTCPTCNGTGEKKLDSPNREKIASDILKVWYPNDKYKELDGSELILLNMKCFAVAKYIEPLIVEANKRSDERVKFVSRQVIKIYEKRIEDAKKQGAIDWIEKHRAKVSVFVTFDTEGVEDSVLIKVKDLQALNKKEETHDRKDSSRDEVLG